MTILLPQHLADLRRSGLTDATIRESGIHSSTDPEAVGRILNWRWPAWGFGPCMVIPFRDPASGELNGFCRIRPDKPRLDAGKACKYEQPRGVSPRVYFPAAALDAAREPGALLGFTEGEKKALAATQAGRPCLGLCGVFSWTNGKDDSGERRLVDDLSWIDWSNRPTWIAFDTDPARNPNVAHARAELARVLTDRGARLFLIDLPVGPRGADGIHEKMAVDDFIFRFGEQSFRGLVDTAVADRTLVRDLEDYRRELEAMRVKSLEFPGSTNLDRSATGTGKSRSGARAMAEAGSSLTVVRTHRAAKETVEEFADADPPVSIVAYPQLTKDTCENFTEAEEALNVGLMPSSAVCPGCPHRTLCDYRADLEEAEAAAHAALTHKRAELSFDHVARSRKFISIEEDCVELFRPCKQVAGGLENMAAIASVGVTVAWFTKRFAEWDFFTKLEEVCRWLFDELQRAENTIALPMPPTAIAAPGTDVALLKAIRQHVASGGAKPKKEVVEITRAITAGEVAEIVIQVSTNYRRGQPPEAHKSILAIWQRRPPDDSVIWINDATADAEEIAAVAGRPVVDRTPAGYLPQKQPILQITRDVTKSTRPNKVAEVVRGVLAAFPEFRRVGIICDRTHVSVIKGISKSGHNLDAATRSRIVQVEYYRSGQSRGSNSWLENCDAIFCIGTPRVPPEAVQKRLLCRGLATAAARNGKWDAWWWSGVDTSGKRHTVRSLGYRDRDWATTHHSIVGAEVIQSAGRGRGVLDRGIPVIVVSNEELGYTLLPFDPQPVSEIGLDTLAVIAKLTEVFATGLGGASYRKRLLSASSLANTSVSSEAVAKAINRTDRQARSILSELEAAGLVERIGQRGGWRLTERGAALVAGGGSDERPDERPDEKSGESQGESQPAQQPEPESQPKPEKEASG